jgi:hypothetical protein
MRLMPIPQYQFGGFTIQALRLSAILLKETKTTIKTIAYKIIFGVHLFDWNFQM